MFRIHFVLAGAAILAASAFASGAVASPEPTPDLHRRAVAAIPAARAELDSQLTDYPTARFRNVHVRMVRSVYNDDEGQSNKVPWTHRGGPILVFCGEINAKNRMGGYGGWQQFMFKPAQTDMVAMYDLGTPRTLKMTNVAAGTELKMAGANWVSDEEIALLCASSSSGEQTDPADLSGAISHHVH